MQVNKIFITCGHSKSDPGAISEDRSTTERSVVEEVCRCIDSDLIQFVGLDENLTVTDKVNKVNAICKAEGLAWKNSILVSLHADWYGASSGTMAYHYRDSDTSKSLAEAILSESKLHNKGSFPDTRSRFGKLGIIYYTAPLACLIEVGSLGPNLEYIKNNSYEIATSILKGIEKFAGITIENKYKPTPETPIEETPIEEPTICPTQKIDEETLHYIVSEVYRLNDIVENLSLDNSERVFSARKKAVKNILINLKLLVDNKL